MFVLCWHATCSVLFQCAISVSWEPKCYRPQNSANKKWWMLDAALEIRLQAHCGSQANSAIPRSHVSTRRACGYIVVVTNLYEIHTFPQRSFPIISVWEASMMTTTSSVPLLICNKSSVKRWTIFPHRWLPATPTGCASLYSTLQRHAVSPFLFWAKEFFCFLKGGISLLKEMSFVSSVFYKQEILAWIYQKRQLLCDEKKDKGQKPCLVQLVSFV